MLNALRIETGGEPAPAAAPSDPRELAAELAPRAQLYRLLSAAFVEEASEQFLEAIRAPESLAALAEAGLSFDDDFLAAETPVLVERLACEYTTMFAASGGFPPVESVRLTGRYQQEPYFTAKQEYARNGFIVTKGRFAVFEDSLGVELLFAAELLERAAAALAREDVAGYRRLERELKRFWTLHLGRWVRGYARLVQRGTEHSFYREMARLLESFAEAEVALMRLRVEDADKGRLVMPKQEPRVGFNPDEPVCNACTAGADPLADLRS
ncbi:MAG: hypothetical protein Fur0039_26800 [Rhodocyclaceae bacterium]